MKKKTSLKDIAQKLGVSIALVSYVLNNKKEGRINKEVALKIKDTAKELNYRTNQIARSLKTNKTNTIGVIVPDIANPFFSSLARIIEDEADKFGYTVIFGSSDEDEQKSQKLIDTFINRQVDGLIITPADNSIDQIKYLEQEGIPFVLVDRYFPELKSNYVALDNFKAAYNATEYLIEAGYKNIGLITYKSSLHNLQERRTGYIAALKQHNAEVRKSLVKEIQYIHTVPGVDKALSNLLALKEPPDAIIFGSNIFALQALKYINEHNIKVPEQLAIVTFDESDALELFQPSITYIKQPLLKMGNKAVNILLDNINRNNTTSQIKIDGELIVRKSTASITEPVA